MLKDYSTIIDAETTIGEIQKKLSSYNVSAMMTEYDGPQVSSVSFKLRLENKDMSFKLPCNWRAVAQVLREQGLTTGSIKHKDKSIDNQAIRTSWRILLHWIDAQLALVEVNMVTIPQIFLPYTIMPDNRTLGEHVADNPGFLLSKGTN
jgi:hypothetical protein